MPASVKKAPKGGYDIVDPTGKKLGHSDSKENAQKSANARNAAKYGDWKPTRKGGK